MNSLKNIRVVLVEPKYGGNIGSVCRVMMNMGVTDLALVGAPENFDWEEARKLAFRAEPMLEKAKVFPSLAEAVADCTVVAGTSARTGFYRDHAYLPREIAPVILDSAAHHKTALVFGREDKGLFNEEIAVCTHLINIPSSELYRSLNLSHAVMLCCYELFLLANNPSYVPPEEGSPEADGKMRERLYEAWSALMLETGFCEKEKLEHMMLGLRRIFSRGKLTENDVKILLGLAKQTRWTAAELKRRPLGGNGAGGGT